VTGWTWFNGYVGHAVHVMRALRLPGSVCMSSGFFLELMETRLTKKRIMLTDHGRSTMVGRCFSFAHVKYSRSELGDDRNWEDTFRSSRPRFGYATRE